MTDFLDPERPRSSCEYEYDPCDEPGKFVRPRFRGTAEILNPGRGDGRSWRAIKEDPNWAINAPVALNEHFARLQRLRDEDKFQRLCKQWKTRKSHSAVLEELVVHPAYLCIIGMGKTAVPMILAELEREMDHWFCALFAITEAEPVSESDQGNMNKMAAAWIRWAKEQGYKW